jgi:hypothetical protein
VVLHETFLKSPVGGEDPFNLLPLLARQTLHRHFPAPPICDTAAFIIYRRPRGRRRLDGLSFSLRRGPADQPVNQGSERRAG